MLVEVRHEAEELALAIDLDRVRAALDHGDEAQVLANGQLVDAHVLLRTVADDRADAIALLAALGERVAHDCARAGRGRIQTAYHARQSSLLEQQQHL